MTKQLIDFDALEPVTDNATCAAIERFYYREARLLDGRRFQQWLSLLSEDIDYRMPSRFIATPDAALRGSEAYHDVEQELEIGGPNQTPLRVENLFTLAIRVDRAYKVNAWAENPPPRTRRIVGNIEVFAFEGGRFACCSNFIMHYSRHDNVNVTYSGQRQDILLAESDSFIVQQRLVIHDWNVIAAPTMGLLF